MDWTFQLTRYGTVPAAGPYTSTITIPLSTAEYAGAANPNAFYGFEMKTVFWCSDAIYNGFYTHAFGARRSGGLTTTVAPVFGTAVEVFGVTTEPGGSGITSVNGIGVVGNNIQVTINWFAGPPAPGGNRLWRAYINGYSCDNA